MVKVTVKISARIRLIAAPAEQPVPAPSASDDAELVAVITAAIAAMMDHMYAYKGPS